MYITCTLRYSKSSSWPLREHFRHKPNNFSETFFVFKHSWYQFSSTNVNTNFQVLLSVSNVHDSPSSHQIGQIFHKAMERTKLEQTNAFASARCSYGWVMMMALAFHRFYVRTSHTDNTGKSTDFTWLPSRSGTRIDTFLNVQSTKEQTKRDKDVYQNTPCKTRLLVSLAPTDWLNFNVYDFLIPISFVFPQRPLLLAFSTAATFPNDFFSSSVYSHFVFTFSSFPF